MLQIEVWLNKCLCHYSRVFHHVTLLWFLLPFEPSWEDKKNGEHRNSPICLIVPMEWGKKNPPYTLSQESCSLKSLLSLATTVTIQQTKIRNTVNRRVKWKWVWGQKSPDLSNTAMQKQSRNQEVGDKIVLYVIRLFS